MESQWYLYVLRCADGSLYTGITTDVERRFAVHQSGKGAKYTRGRGPLEIAYQEICADHSDALKREYAFKQLSREQKLSFLERAAMGEKMANCLDK